jgi:hypothetical protein
MVTREPEMPIIAPLAVMYETPHFVPILRTLMGSAVPLIGAST